MHFRIIKRRTDLNILLMNGIMAQIALNGMLLNSFCILLLMVNMQRTKATTMSFSAEPEFVRMIGRVISKTGAYHSKSEFLRDAARQRAIQLMGLEDELKRVHEVTKELRKRVKFVRELTPEDKDKIVDKYFKQ